MMNSSWDEGSVRQHHPYPILLLEMELHFSSLDPPRRLIGRSNHASLHAPPLCLIPTLGWPLSTSLFPPPLKLLPLLPSSPTPPPFSPATSPLSSANRSSGILGFPPRLASTTSLSAVGASSTFNSLAVKILGKTFHRKGISAMMRTGNPMPAMVCETPTVAVMPKTWKKR